jgi:hypothetical protein
MFIPKKLSIALIIKHLNKVKFPVLQILSLVLPTIYHNQSTI